MINKEEIMKKPIKCRTNTSKCPYLAWPVYPRKFLFIKLKIKFYCRKHHRYVKKIKECDLFNNSELQNKMFKLEKAKKIKSKL